MTANILNTKGAAAKLECTENWIHKLVYAGRLRAFVYNDAGVLTERNPEEKRRGQGLYFYESDLKGFKKRAIGRPAKSKDRKPRVLKSAQKQPQNT